MPGHSTSVQTPGRVSEQDTAHEIPTFAGISLDAAAAETRLPENRLSRALESVFGEVRVEPVTYFDDCEAGGG